MKRTNKNEKISTKKEHSNKKKQILKKLQINNYTKNKYYQTKINQIQQQINFKLK